MEAGVSEKRIVYAHGSLQYATCAECKRKAPRSEIEEDIWAGRVARCPAILAESKAKPTTERANNTNGRSTRRRPLDEDQSSNAAGSNLSMRTRGVARKERTCRGVLKPGVTFFGETLGDNVRRCLEADYNKVDALIVIGTSLSV